MRWPFRYKRRPSDVAGIRKAEMALEMAKLLECHATQSAKVHADILRRNGLGPKIHNALMGQPVEGPTTPNHRALGGNQ